MQHEADTRKAALDHAWRYFALHAAQRMSVFNYFIVLFGLVSAGLAACLRSEGALRLAGAALGVCLALTAWTFWKLDQRTAFLLKHAEVALAELECSVFDEPGRLVDSERRKAFRDPSLALLARRIWTYRQAFRVVFIAAAVIGLGSAILCIGLYFGEG